MDPIPPGIRFIITSETKICSEPALLGCVMEGDLEWINEGTEEDYRGTN